MVSEGGTELGRKQTPRLPALSCALVWYDEPPEALYRCVRSAGLLADHLVAVDGPYALFPHEDPVSASEQYDAIRDAAADAGMSVHIEPGKVWEGNQTEKRTRALQLVEAHAQTFVDWFFVLDADEYIESADRAGLLDALAGTKANNAAWEVITNDGPGFSFNAFDFPGEQRAKPRLFRVLKDLKVRESHNLYQGQNSSGHFVCVNGMNMAPHYNLLPSEPIDVRHLVSVRHDVLNRSDERSELKKQYYHDRAGAGIDVPFAQKQDLQKLMAVEAALVHEFRMAITAKKPAERITDIARELRRRGIDPAQL